jgi:hypothetical protein
MPKRNKFSRSHYNLLTMNMGELIPIYCDEVIPGDIWQQRTSALIRVSPQVKPTMHPVRVRIHHWYVPTRLIWDDYEDFYTGGQDGTETPTHPYYSIGSTVNEGSLFDYLGYPPGTYPYGQNINALFLRAYQTIYNEHYRDQDLISEYPVAKTSGLDSTTNENVRKVAWEKDRFTTARSSTQRGDDISIPLGDSAPVVTNGEVPRFEGHVSSFPGTLSWHTGNVVSMQPTSGYTDGEQLQFESESGLEADLSGVAGITLEDLRLALGRQRYMEIMNRAGARYGEYARAIFNVNNPDSRLQIPEYLGGGRQTISFSEILATAEGTSTDVGDLKGHGIAAMRTRRYRRFIPEHGIIMSLMSVVPRTIYTQAIERQLLRNYDTVKEDYFVPQLQGIGDDEIYNNEVYGLHSNPGTVFGYHNRYEEYRSKESRVSGEMNSSPGYNWHLGRIHAGDIALNQSFIDCNPSKRILADQASDSLQVMASHSIQTRRPIGRTGMPSKI